MARSPLGLAQIFQQAIATFRVADQNAVKNEIGVLESDPETLRTVSLQLFLDADLGSVESEHNGDVGTVNGTATIIEVTIDGVKQPYNFLPSMIQRSDTGSLQLLDNKGLPIPQAENQIQSTYDVQILGCFRLAVAPIIDSILGQDIKISIVDATRKGGVK